MTRNTKLNFSGEDALWESTLRFLRVAGAGLIATALAVLGVLPPGPEVLLVTALLVALDKYLRTKGFYLQAANAVFR